MKTKIYELVPCGTSQKSFYGKAQVYISGDIYTLYSYGTPIMKVDISAHNICRIYNGYSATTNKHCISFMNSLSYIHSINKWYNLPCNIWTPIKFS